MVARMMVLIGLMLLLITACKPDANMPNPASVYCEDNNGKFELRQEKDGGQVGYCIFEDDSECEEWAFFRGECLPGDSLASQIGIANPASVYCEALDGTLDTREDPVGGQVGYCLFEDGSECLDWDLFRGDCLPGDN